jgi:hypothetical protein
LVKEEHRDDATCWIQSVADETDFEVSAALLRRANDAGQLVEQLAARLHRALPNNVQIERKSWRDRRPKSLSIELPPLRFRFELDDRRVGAWVDHIVREVCIRSEELTVDDWLDRLATALSAEARRSVNVRLALEEALE